jgi:hypothetical protein
MEIGILADARGLPLAVDTMSAAAPLHRPLDSRSHHRPNSEPLPTVHSMGEVDRTISRLIARWLCLIVTHEYIGITSMLCLHTGKVELRRSYPITLFRWHEVPSK